MLAAQEEMMSSALEVEIGVAPGVKVGAAAKGLSCVIGGVLSGVVDESEGEVKAPREFAKSGEDGRDLSGVVFIDTLEPDVRVKDQEHGLVALKGFAESSELVGAVDSE